MHCKSAMKISKFHLYFLSMINIEIILVLNLRMKIISLIYRRNSQWVLKNLFLLFRLEEEILTVALPVLAA